MEARETLKDTAFLLNFKLYRLKEKSIQREKIKMKKVFIGSSSESIYIAKKIQRILEDLGAQTTMWTDSEAFRLSHNTLDELIHAAHTHNGGVFIFNTDDELSDRHSDNIAKFVPRDNVIAEAGIFTGVLGKEPVVLCTVDDVHVASDFNGVTTLEYTLPTTEKEKKLKSWLDNNVSEFSGKDYKNNVLMLPRKEIHDFYSIDSRLHITDGLYKKIRRIRIMNFASNLIINPEIGEMGHIPSKDIRLSDAIEKIATETSAALEVILTEPTQYNLADLQSKIANYNAGSAEGALYSALATMYKNLSADTIYRKRATEVPIHLWLYTLRTSMPFGIFNVEFMDEAKKYNHVKVDIYSAALDNEDDRRSFVIWQKDDPKNYKFFVDNFNDIKQNRTLCTRHRSFEKLKKWAQEWDNMKPGGLN